MLPNTVDALVVTPFVKLDTLVRLCASLLKCEGIRSKKLIFLQDSPVGIRLEQARAKEEEYLWQADRVQTFLNLFKELHSSSFLEIQVLSNERNLGPYKTCQIALDYAFESADFAIFAEDDTIFSSDAMYWFDFCHSNLLGHDSVWAIAGESIFFDSRTSTATAEQVGRLRRIADSQGLVNKYTAMDWVAPTCFAMTREAWITFGPIRGQTCGDIALNEFFKKHELRCVFPVMPRVKDIGMLHPDGFSVAVHGEDLVQGENKNVLLMSEDSYLAAKQFEPYLGNRDELYAATSLLDERFIRLLEGSEHGRESIHLGQQDGGHLADVSGSPDRSDKSRAEGGRREIVSPTGLGRRRLSEPIRKFNHGDEAAVSVNAVDSAPLVNDYLDMLRRLHELVDPGVYLEIGVHEGASLTLSHSRAIGIDPAPRVDLAFYSHMPNLALYSMTSDAFFAEHTLESVLGMSRVDLGFIDGLHRFEQVLRDFVHVEQWSSPTGVVAIHDVIPPSEQAATRVCESETWCGDVWQLVSCLQQYRPDLDCMLVDVPPSGMLIVRNLNPGSEVLTTNMPRILRSVPEDGDSYAEAIRGFLADARAFSPEEALDRLGTTALGNVIPHSLRR
jgi:hypothetical protein